MLRLDEIDMKLITPRSIAIVGARDGPGEAANLHGSLVQGGFPGSVYMVNPNRDHVLGSRCFPSLADVPVPVDLAVLVVPAGHVNDVLSTATRNGVPLCLIYSDIAAREVQIPSRTDGARATRVVGPSSLGFLNFSASTHAMVVGPDNIPKNVRQGDTYIIGQSGGLVLAATEYAACAGLGLHAVLSTGSEVDVTASELAIQAITTGESDGVGLILEGLRDPEVFIDCARIAAIRGTPLVVLKLGRSRAGAAHAVTHSQSLTGSNEVFLGICREYGVMTADTLTEFVELLRLSQGGRNIKSSGVAALTLSGGAKVLTADLADELGIRFAHLSEATHNRLGELLGESGGSNPVDLGAIAIENQTRLRSALTALSKDECVGVIALVTHLRQRGGSPAYQRLILDFADFSRELQNSGKLGVVVSTTPEGVGGVSWTACVDAGIPVLHDLTSLGTLARYLNQRPPIRTVGSPPAVAPATVAALREAASQAHPTVPLMDVMRDAGIPFVAASLTHSRAEALKVARRFGFPVALKVDVADLLHKTDVGGVAIGINSRSELLHQYNLMVARTRAALGADFEPEVIVQEMANGSAELLLAGVTDPLFGRVVTFGLGGIFVDQLRDVVAAPAPIEEATAMEMISSLRSQYRLDGSRGSVAIDRTRLAKIIVLFSALFVELPEDISSLEINPIIAAGERFLGVDVAVSRASVGGPSQNQHHV